MEIVITSVISIGLVIYALFVAQRANLDSVKSRLFWYIVIIFIPLFGALFAILYGKKFYSKASVDSKLQAAIIEIYSKSTEVNANMEKGVWD